MQLRRLSIVLSFLLTTSSVFAEDYVSVNYMSYDEDSSKVTIHTPEIEISKDLGVDYNIKLTYSHDSVSGASPTFYDSMSGASATIEDKPILRQNIKYGNINYEDDRKSTSVSLTKRFVNRDELTVGYNYSDEKDYTSKEFSMEYLHYLDSSKNSSITFGGSYQSNDVGIYCFLNTSECDTKSGASSKISKKNLDAKNFEIGYTQIIDKTSLYKFSIFTIIEDGYLSNPYMRVVRDFYTIPKITQEQKPDSRKSYGATFEYTKAFNEKLSSIIDYRFYNDDWGITSHTLTINTYYEVSSKFTLGASCRGYTQSSADFYSNRADFFTNQKYASSDRRVSSFDSYNLSTSLKYKIDNKLSINSGIGYYKQRNYFDAKYYNIGFKYKY